MPKACSQLMIAATNKTHQQRSSTKSRTSKKAHIGRASHDSEREQDGTSCRATKQVPVVAASNILEGAAGTVRYLIWAGLAGDRRSTPDEGVRRESRVPPDGAYPMRVPRPFHLSSGTSGDSPGSIYQRIVKSIIMHSCFRFVPPIDVCQKYILEEP